MPVYDRICEKCGAVKLDLMEPMHVTYELVCDCGGVMKRGFTQRSTTVIPDSIPGGFLAKHGICEDDGTPKRYDSKSEMKAAAAARGLENMVRHVPLPGTDKSPHTVRWTGARILSEEERVAHMRAQWEAEGIDLDRLPAPPTMHQGVESVVEDHLHRVIAREVTQRFGV